MSKKKRGRKCAGRHCAWCAPVLTVSEAQARQHADNVASEMYWFVKRRRA